MEIVPRANREVSLLIERAGPRRGAAPDVPAFGKYEMGDIGVLPHIRPQIATVNPGTPPPRPGCGDDVIVGVGGVSGPSYEQVLDQIKAHEGRPLDLRAGARRPAVSVTVTPRVIDGAPRIGANISSKFELRTIEPGPFEALQLSVQRNWEWSVMIVDTLAGLFTRDTSVKQLMGPVAIAEISGSAAEQGWIPLFSLMAMISLNLGLLNLMPIPVLDGGHILPSSRSRACRAATSA
jgi:regulator of sigma E protease